VTLGHAALYIFMAHWFVYAVMGGAFFQKPGDLQATNLVWIVGLVALYPICKAYEVFKHRMPAASVWRMI
jgi:peptidoglycan/LPS O-acetylase OafA/YrhL